MAGMYSDCSTRESVVNFTSIHRSLHLEVSWHLVSVKLRCFGLVSQHLISGLNTSWIFLYFPAAASRSETYKANTWIIRDSRNLLILCSKRTYSGVMNYVPSSGMLLSLKATSVSVSDSEASVVCQHLGLGFVHITAYETEKLLSRG